ncbi:MAG: Uma2 family endonuclease [Chloroflexi bacterium]|nr:Uma2 family endonuclease [Chloroflexota bacterium]
MTTVARPSVEYYFDCHPTPEDLMGYNELQARLVKYLLDVLGWLFRTEGWYIAMDLNIYVSDDSREEPAAPDVAVFKGVALPDERDEFISSWRVAPPDAPAPAIVFEVASAGTWRKDLEQKPGVYALMGVREYVYFDPRPRRPKGSPAMRVWRMEEGTPVELPADEQGRVWSEELRSWLGADGKMLRLFERNGQMRLTGEEAERAEKEVERAEKEAERARKERAWAELRKMGVDPESLS